MAESNHCAQCGSPCSTSAPGGLCPRCLREQGKSQPRTRVLRLMAIVVLLVVGGVGVASYFGTAAYRKREAILSKFGNAQANYERAFALHQQGKLAEAIEEYRAVLRVIPGHSYAHYNLGLALASQGDSAAAAESFRKARTFGQGDAELNALVDRALAAIGR